MAGGYRRGEIISELTIASEFSISRGPVREALLMLASAGLLVHNPNRGFAGLDFSEQDVAHVERVRLALEPLALAASKEHAADIDVQRLVEIKNELVDAFRAGQTVDCISAEIRFHESIWHLCGNPWLAASLQRVMIPALTYGAGLRMNRAELTPARMDTRHQIYIDYIGGASVLSAEHCVHWHLGREATTT